MESALSLLPMLGALAVVALGQLKVKPRSDEAALGFMVGGGVEAAYRLITLFVDAEVLWWLAPVVHVAAVGGVVFGLVKLVDAVNPRHPGQLPPALGSMMVASPDLLVRGLLGFFGLAAIGMSFSVLPGPFLLASVVGVAMALAGSVWVEKQGGLAHWVLERRPDLVVWAYPHRLTITHRQTRATSTHWSARVGLATGVVVTLPATSEQQAQVLAASVAQHCPGITVGYSADHFARFKREPASLRSGGR